MEVNVTVSEEAPATPSLTPPPKPEPAEDAPKEDPVVKEAMALLDKARSAFLKGDYPQAQELIEKGIKKVPGDATLHEFRALTLFAQKKYQEAIAAIYAVLAAGPGWDWETLKEFYPDVQTYTAQLRDLERFQRSNPDKGYASLLLAYHYLTLESLDAAAKQLQNAVKVEPKDQLSAQLLAALKKVPDGNAPPPPQGG